MATSQLIPQQQVDIQPNGTSRLYCDFISPGYNCRVWVDLAPFDQAPTVENNFADAWIRMLIFEMMHVGGRFEVKGAVSLTLLRNLEHFMEAWSQMHPEYLNVVDIKPDRIIDEKRAGGRFCGCPLFPGAGCDLRLVQACVPTSETAV